VVIFHPENTSTSIGSTATLECKAKGDPEPRYYWYKNGEPLPANDDIKPDKSKLVLRKTIIQDQAWYYCSVFNVANTTSSKSAYLKIYGKYS
jgi:hypothetical protein